MLRSGGAGSNRGHRARCLLPSRRTQKPNSYHPPITLCRSLAGLRQCSISTSGSVAPSWFADPRETALFLSRKGRRLHPTSFHLLIRKHARAARLPLRPSVRALRKACATQLLAGGADVRHAQELFAHPSIGTTALYTQVEVKDLREVLIKSSREQRFRRRA